MGWWTAVLALALAQAPGQDPTALGLPNELAKPVRIRAVLDDGSKVAGLANAWGEDAISGDFGHVLWLTMASADLNRIYQVVMDKKDAKQWIALGTLLRAKGDAEKASDNAFTRALRLDKALKEEVEEAKERGDDLHRQRGAGKLAGTLPEGSKAWPILSQKEQEEAVSQMKADALQYCREAALGADLRETEFFILLTDLPRGESDRIAGALDGMYRRVADIIGLPSGVNIFWGKAVVFVARDRARFQAMEAAAFSSNIPNTVAGLCHMIGPRVFVNSFRDPDELRFSSVLVHETVHGIMHRFLSPAPLPTWANEGFSEYVASICFRGSPVDTERRPQALQYIRGGGSVTRILDMTYEAGTWPGENAVGYAVGYVLTELMLKDQPAKFAAWVRAIKGGKEWRRALVEDFETTPPRLANTAETYFRTND